MKLSQLVLKSMLKNIKHYYLYFFALIFSVTLYFSFETLQYNPSVLEATTQSGTATAGFGAATYMLYAIVLIFVLYANHLFIRRRSKEIGLYQLIGMTKGLVIRLMALENIVLFVGSVAIGMLTGLLTSRLFAMILLKVLHFEAVVEMSLSKEAVVSTTRMFAILLIIILIQMAWMVRRTTLLALFTASKQADEKVRRFSVWQMSLGAIGLVLIGYGYYKSSVLFTKDPMNLFRNMIIILATTIGGTFLVFRFSVAFILNIFRLRKKGHLRLGDVLALTPIMHRMKSNANSLTLITILTAVSLAITTLSYISYYSAADSAKKEVPADYVSVNGREASFLQQLDVNGISYSTDKVEIVLAEIEAQAFLSKDLAKLMENERGEVIMIPLSDYKRFYPELTLADDEVVVTSYNSFMSKFMPIKVGQQTKLYLEEEEIPVVVKAVHEDAVLSWRVTGNGPVLVVSEQLFADFKQSTVPEKMKQKIFKQVGITLENDERQVEAEKLYKTTAANVLDEEENSKLASRKAVEEENLQLYGTTIFTTAFLGLAFLLATGSILYFKQMSEADEESTSYIVLRKIGFSEHEILRGVMLKQAFSFGVPLVMGLLHSYFAVKSGWFLFGSELTTPLLVTMGLYIAMYALFAGLTINYYKKIIRECL